MSTYVTYFETILSFFVKNFAEAEDVLPTSSTNDREKCKDFDIESANWISIGRPISLAKLISYFKGNNNNV
jgi:hypothetical protein